MRWVTSLLLVVCGALPARADGLPAPNTPAEDAAVTLLPTLARCVSITSQEVHGPASATVFLDQDGRVAALNVSSAGGGARLYCPGQSPSELSLVQPGVGGGFGAPVLDGARLRVRCDVERTGAHCEGTHVSLQEGVEGPERPTVASKGWSNGTQLRVPKATPQDQADTPASRRVGRALLYCLNLHGADVPLAEEDVVSFQFSSGAAAPHLSDVKPGALNRRVVPCMIQVLRAVPASQLPQRVAYVFPTLRGMFRQRQSGTELLEGHVANLKTPRNVAPATWMTFEDHLRGAVSSCVAHLPTPDRPPANVAAVYRLAFTARMTGGTTSALDLGHLKVDGPVELARIQRCVEQHYHAEDPRPPVVDVSWSMDITLAPAAGGALYYPH